MAVLDDQVQALGWFLIAPVMLGCAIMLVCALLVNNLQRRFPMYWWSPEKTGGVWSGPPGKDGSGEEVTMETEEKGGEKGLGGKAGSSSESRLGRGARSDETLREGDVDIEAQSGTLSESGDDNDNEGRRKKKEDGDGDGDERGPRVVISRGGVEIPEGLSLRPEEVSFLETICERL